MIRVWLKRGEDRRVRSGHVWVFSNEIDRIEGSEKGPPTPGSLAQLVTVSGELLAFGYYNRNSLIAFRVLSRDPKAEAGPLIASRIAEALAFRRTVYGDGGSYRLIYSEGDLLPGLVVDRYENYLVVQILTAGMEALTPMVLDALESAVKPQAIVLRNDASIRELEGLPLQVAVARGELAGPVTVEVDGLKIRMDLMGGQKTGFFLDQRENRLALGRYVRGHRVLDLFGYYGTWALHALKAGAASALVVDASKGALDLATEAANANGLAAQFAVRQGDCFDVLKELSQAGDLYDTVVVDPPAFARTKKDNKAARLAYERINKLALRCLKPGGILATSTCSYHVSREEFMGCVARALSGSGRTARVLENRGQSVDHAPLLAMPEGAYLKCVFLQVL